MYKNAITKTACKIYKKEKNNRENFVRKLSFARNLLIFDEFRNILILDKSSDIGIEYIKMLDDFNEDREKLHFGIKQEKRCYLCKHKAMLK